LVKENRYKLGYNKTTSWCIVFFLVVRRLYLVHQCYLLRLVR